MKEINPIHLEQPMHFESPKWIRKDYLIWFLCGKPEILNPNLTIKEENSYGQIPKE